MKRRKLLGLAFMVMLAISSIAAATASAEATLPNILPLPTATETVSGTSTGGASKFGNGLVAITATGSSGTQESEGLSGKLGIFKTTFVGATSALGKCTTTGKTAGEILVEGVFHIRDYKASGALAVADIFLLKPVNFLCGTVPVEVNGCVAGALTKENEVTSLLQAALNVTGGDNQIVTVLNEANTAEEACQLLARVNGAATELSSQETTQLLTGFKKGAATTTLEVMPL